MSLADRVNDELKEAMRAKDSTRLDSLRALRNEIIKLTKSGNNAEVQDDDVVKLVKTLIKQRQDSISMFEKAGRHDLSEIESLQMTILKNYLPDQLSEDELKKIIDTAIEDSNASSIKDMGIVMKTVMALIKDSGKDADNRMVSMLVKSALAL